MEKISLNTLFKLTKLVESIEDNDLSDFLDKVAQDATEQAISPTGMGDANGSDALMQLFDFCTDFKDTAQQLVRAAIEQQNVDPTKLLSVSGNLEKSVTNFLQEISDLIASEQQVTQDTLAQQVQNAASPVMTSPMNPYPSQQGK